MQFFINLLLRCAVRRIVNTNQYNCCEIVVISGSDVIYLLKIYLVYMQQIYNTCVTSVFRQFIVHYACDRRVVTATKHGHLDKNCLCV